MNLGGRPKFSDLLKFVKHRAKLVNNEFGDLIASPESEEKRGRTLTRMTTLATNVDSDHSEERSSARREIGTNRSCPVCSGQHGLWRCEKFRDLSSRDRVKTVLNKRLCFKCLGGGHFKNRCPKETFKYQVQGCVEDHNTLLHPAPPTLEENRPMQLWVIQVQHTEPIKMVRVVAELRLLQQLGPVKGVLLRGRSC